MRPSQSIAVLAKQPDFGARFVVNEIVPASSPRLSALCVARPQASHRVAWAVTFNTVRYRKFWLDWLITYSGHADDIA